MIKYCPNCKIEVGGAHEYCPLCQNELHIGNMNNESDDTIEKDIVNEDMEAPQFERYFPERTDLKTKSFWYKLQQFIMYAAVAVCLMVDFLIDFNGEIHWSFIVLVWVAGFEILLNTLMRRHSLPIYFVAYIALFMTLPLLPTAYYLGFFPVCINYICPCICMVALIFNFIFCIIDKTGNALVYLLCNITVGILPSLIMIAINGMAPLFWIICLMTTVVFLIALIIFSGPKVRSELEKRLNF